MAFAAILVTILFWASSFVVIRICLGPLTPIELATARYVAAGAIALVYLAIYRPMPERRDFLRLSIAAVLFIAAYAVLLNTGEQTVAAGPASFIINTMPMGRTRRARRTTLSRKCTTSGTMAAPMRCSDLQAAERPRCSISFPALFNRPKGEFSSTDRMLRTCRRSSEILRRYSSFR